MVAQTFALCRSLIVSSSVWFRCIQYQYNLHHITTHGTVRESCCQPHKSHTVVRVAEYLEMLFCLATGQCGQHSWQHRRGAWSGTSCVTRVFTALRVSIKPLPTSSVRAASGSRGQPHRAHTVVREIEHPVVRSRPYLTTSMVRLNGRHRQRQPCVHIIVACHSDYARTL